jgi:hypothetical protein
MIRLRRYKMDTRYFGAHLLTLYENQADRRPLAKAAEDAYYERHGPAEGRIPRIASLAAAVVFGFATMGFWLR